MSIDQAFSSRKLAKQFYEEWVNEVKRHVPPEKLLVYKVQSGWKPLCEFLDVPVPSNMIPFPRSNDKQEIRRSVHKALVIAWFYIFAVIAVAVTLFTSCDYFYAPLYLLTFVSCLHFCIYAFIS